MSAERQKSDPSTSSGGSDPHYSSLTDLGLAALSAPSLDIVLATAVRCACHELRTEFGAVFELLPGFTAVRLRSGVGWPKVAAGRMTLPLSEIGVLYPGAAAPVVLQDVRASAAAPAAWLHEQGVVSGLAVPVPHGGACYGWLGVYTPVRRDFGQDHVHVLQGIGDLLSAAATRDQRDQMLRDSEARLSGIIASAMDAIIAVDEAQRIVLFNHAAERVFGCSASAVLGTPLERFIPARLRTAHREHIRRFGESGATVGRMGWLDPLCGLRADGEEFPIEASVSHAEVGGKRIITVILRDISERRRLEGQLLHSQKLESVGRLAGGVAHDFNNMLTAIFGYLDLTRTHVDAVGPARECIDAVQVAAERAADLTAKLLAFARKQVVEPQIVDLGQLVRNVMGMAGRLLGDDVDVVVHEAPLLPRVRVDPGQFEQVLVNLAVNARDAMPKGGKFIVETSCMELDQEYARLCPSVQPGTYVQLAVSDTGEGMDPVTLEHCFEPFFTTKSVGHGTGLGLATCHGIVNQSGGHISVYSERGRGTTFRIFLPAVAGPARPTPSGSTLETQSRTGTILLVEDDALVRGISVRTLRDCGYTVLEAADASEAVARAAHVNGPIDLLLTDVVLPKVSGPELAEQLRQSRPEMRVLYTSGFTDNVIVHHRVLAPGVSFLAKPYTPSTLTGKIRQVLEQPADVRVVHP